MTERALVSALLLAAACSSTSPTSVAPPASTPTPTPTPAPAATARYRVSLQATWSAATHPQSFPSGPHFSKLIGATHGPALRLWEPGALASTGIEAMAETGSTSPLDAEIAAAQANGAAENLLLGGGIGRSPGSVSVEFDVSLAKSHVTLVTMIAPSPDWFTGVSAQSLLADGVWVEMLSVPVLPWDAGTDSGPSYTSGDDDTSPAAPIAAPAGGPLVVGGAVPTVGQLLFERLQ